MDAFRQCTLSNYIVQGIKGIKGETGEKGTAGRRGRHGVKVRTLHLFVQIIASSTLFVLLLNIP